MKEGNENKKKKKGRKREQRQKRKKKSEKKKRTVLIIKENDRCTSSGPSVYVRVNLFIIQKLT